MEAHVGGARLRAPCPLFPRECESGDDIHAESNHIFGRVRSSSTERWEPRQRLQPSGRLSAAAARRTPRMSQSNALNSATAKAIEAHCPVWKCAGLRGRHEQSHIVPRLPRTHTSRCHAAAAAPRAGRRPAGNGRRASARRAVRHLMLCARVRIQPRVVEYVRRVHSWTTRSARRSCTRWLGSRVLASR